MSTQFLLQTANKVGIFTQKQHLWAALEDMQMTESGCSITAADDYEVAPSYRALCDTLRKKGDIIVVDDEEPKAIITILAAKNELRVATQICLEQEDLDEYSDEELCEGSPQLIEIIANRDKPTEAKPKRSPSRRTKSKGPLVINHGKKK